MKLLFNTHQERLIKHDHRGCLAISEIWVEQDNVFVKCDNTKNVYRVWFDYEGLLQMECVE